MFQLALIKIGALLSFCGGPLILCDLVKPRVGTVLAFVVTFAPIVFMVFGADSVLDRNPVRRGVTRRRRNPDEPGDSDGRWDMLFVRMGFNGALTTLFLHGFGVWVVATTPRRADTDLYLVGIIVGVPLAAMYVYAAGRWLSRVRPLREPFSPIEPT